MHLEELTMDECQRESMRKMEQIQQAMHAWRITLKVSGSIMSASAALGAKPKRHRLVSLVSITYKFERMNVK